MDLKISKAQMELAIKLLERRAAKVKDVAMFRGIPATAFDKEHLVMLCNLFAYEHYKAEEKYFEVLDKSFPRDVARWSSTKQPSIWRRIWNKIKRA